MVGKRVLATAIMSAVLGSSAMAYEQGDWLLRVGAATVSPDEDVDLDLEIDDSTRLSLVAAYMFSETIGIELLAAMPFRHEVSLPGSGGATLAETKHLPPTLTVQYYAPKVSIVQPYVGIGLNYTIFFEDGLTDVAKSALSVDDIEFDDSVGLAWQVGADVELDKNLFLNFGVWNIDIETTGELSVGGVKAGEVEAAIDPWVYNVGWTFRF